MPATPLPNIPPRPYLLSPTTAVQLLQTTPCTTTIIDARHPSLHELESIQGSFSYPLTSSLPSSTSLLLIYDSGTSSLSHSSRARDLITKLHLQYPHISLALLCGGLPAFKSLAPQYITVNSPLSILTKAQLQLPFVRRALAAAAAAVSPPAQLLDWLYVGPASALEKAKNSGITNVVIIAEEINMIPYHNLDCIRFDVEDHQEFDLLSLLPSIITAMELVRKNGNKCFVHCYAGASRSVAAVVAYFIWKGSTMKEALKRVKHKHPSADPNQGFLDQLKMWENQVLTGMHDQIVTKFSNVWENKLFKKEDEHMEGMIVEVDSIRDTHILSPQQEIREKKKKAMCQFSNEDIPSSPVTPCKLKEGLISGDENEMKMKREMYKERKPILSHFNDHNMVDSLYLTRPALPAKWELLRSSRQEHGNEQGIRASSVQVQQR